MRAYHSLTSFTYLWVTPVLLSGAALLGSLRLFWQEWLIFEALAGFGIAFVNFVWSQMLFLRIREASFDEFVRQFFVWGSLKSALVFGKACAVLTWTELDPTRFVICLLIAYSVFVFCSLNNIINRPAFLKS